ncbi:MAG: class I tRNA ligase family protein [Parcubacteria group bacterium]
MSQFDIIKFEEKTLKFWKDRDIFHRSLKKNKGKKRYVFYDGPPTANGKPGIHHLIGRAFKDLWPRYKTMRGYYCLRRAGWDTQGIPVELEVEKDLGFKSKKDIEKYGVAKFNKKAKESVWKYKTDWEEFVARTGHWIDLEDRYVTYETPYLQSLWHIIQQFDKKGLLYEGYKVLPWCPRCGTSLSSHEVAEGYKDVTEPSVYVKLKLKPNQKIGGKDIQPNTFLTAWTTTRWTLPGNVALAVGKDIEYSIVKFGKDNLIIATERIEAIRGKPTGTKYKGKELVGLEYEPLFDVKPLQNDKSHIVYLADFVTTEDGTGIVHTAVMYGEDDYQLGVKIGLPQHHTVDDRGYFTKDVPGFEGQYVKNAKTEKAIEDDLNKRGLLIKTEEYTHSYPHCWRCKTALLYYATDSWFVGMSKLRKQLIANNNKINWFPSHLRDGRFGEFLREVKDWAFSRARYWGTPLPIWRCTEKDCEGKRVIGSIAELEKHRYTKGNTYYVIRHGESTKNLGKGISSHKLEKDNYELTEKGVEETKLIASKLKEQGGVDLIFTSPFLRTKQTARIIGAELDMSFEVDNRLKEIDSGSVHEGIDIEVLMKNFLRENFDQKYDDGESWRDMKVRMIDFVMEMEKKHENKKILIISHGDPIWGLQGVLSSKSEEELVEEYKTRIEEWIKTRKGKKDEYPQIGEIYTVTMPNYPYSDEGELDIHRPFIDNLHLKCFKCKGRMDRIPEVADVWFDSGSMPYAQWHYPAKNKKLFKENFPADFITEAIDQTRGWFYTLLAVSTALGDSSSYKSVLSYGHVLDKNGKKMSKSLKNIVDPWDVMNQYGADAVRWYFYTVNTPGDSKLFDMEDVKQEFRGFIMTLLNSFHFYELYAGNSKHENTKSKPKSLLDEWILSRLNTVLSEATKALDEYNPTSASRAIEAFVVEDLSNWWIRRSRTRFQKPKNKKELESMIEFLRYLLIELSKIIAPFTPFMADHIYKKIANNEESVHLEDWPKVSKRRIKPELEKQMHELRELVTLGLAQRREKNIKVRQPLQSVTLNKEFPKDLYLYIKEEVNVKEIVYDADQKDSVVLDTKLTPELIEEGNLRDLVRYIQELRKRGENMPEDHIIVDWNSEGKEVSAFIDKHAKEISTDTNTSLKKKSTWDKYTVDKEADFLESKIRLGIKN